MLRLKVRGHWYHIQGKNALGVQIPPHSTGIAVLDEYTHRAAQARLVELEKATRWPLPEEPKPRVDLTLAEAYENWLAKKAEGSKTWWSRRAVKGVILTPLAKQGVVLVKDVAPRHLDDLQHSWTERKPRLRFNTIKTWRANSSCLFNYCVNVLGEITRNPWRGVPVIKEIKPSLEEIMAGKQKDRGIATLPIDLDRSETNWHKIQANAHAYTKGELPGQRRRRRPHAIWQHPDTWPAWLWLLYETGLRRSDALIFRPDWIRDTAHGGSYTTSQRKTGDAVTCFLPQPLVRQLRSLPLLPWLGRRDLYEEFSRKPWKPGAGLYPFYDGSLKNQDVYLTARINLPLAEMGKLIGIPGLRCHRFRDSFAIRMLTLGVTLGDVQRMLGHKDIATTQDYYAHYVLGFQEAVEQRQAAARKQALLYYTEAQQASPLSVN